MIRISLKEELEYYARLVELGVLDNKLEIEIKQIDTIYYYRIYGFMKYKKLLLSEDSMDFKDLKLNYLDLKKRKNILTKEIITGLA